MPLPPRGSPPPPKGLLAVFFFFALEVEASLSPPPKEGSPDKGLAVGFFFAYLVGLENRFLSSSSDSPRSSCFLGFFSF